MKISISGGIVGGIIGAICAGPLGIVFGIGLGLYFINFSPQEDTKRLSHEENDDSVSQKGLQLFFQCLGKLAKSDGRVSEDEAAFVRSIMQAWKLDKEARRQMGAEFNKGRDSSASFLHLVTQLADELDCSHAPYSVRCTIVQAFCALAMADDELHPAERCMLDDAGRVLEAEESVHEFFSDNEEPDDEDKDAEPSSRDSLQHCYDILGISSTATDAEVKSAYRRKAKEFHPDLAEGAGLSANAIRRAKEKFQEIGDAYDTIRQHRGMK